MSDRLHEVIAQIGVLHKELLENEKINNAEDVFEYIEDYDNDVKDHYINLLLQYYFQKNDLENFQKLLLVGAKFDIRFEDIKEAFLNIKSNDDNVIEFMEESVVFIKDSTIDEPLLKIYEYYENNSSLHPFLNDVIELLKKNRYICAYCFNNEDKIYSDFFINEDLLLSLKRDLPYLLNK